MIERDDHIPDLEELVAELAQAKAIAKKILRKTHEHSIKTTPRTIPSLYAVRRPTD